MAARLPAPNCMPLPAYSWIARTTSISATAPTTSSGRSPAGRSTPSPATACPATWETGNGATAAELHDPTGVTVDSAGNVYIADYDNCVIREVTAATGIIATIAGNGTCNFNGDGPAVEHELNHPDRIRVDANGNLFIADDSGQRVRWVNSAG